jgi:hypothetical protein
MACFVSETHSMWDSFYAVNNQALNLFNCYADVDECSSEDACGPNTVCTNSAGSYACACKPGFELGAGKDLKTDGCSGAHLLHTT